MEWAVPGTLVQLVEARGCRFDTRDLGPPQPTGGDNAFVMGGDVEVLAPVHGDLFAMGGQLTVDAPVHGDVYVTGGEVALGPRAAIDGHLYVAAGQVDLQGAVAGDAHVGSGQLTLDAPIHGDLSAEVGQLVLGDRAAVAGDVELVSPDVPARLQAVTGGEVSWEAPPEPQEHDGARVVVADPPAEEGWSVVSEVLWWGGFRMWGYLTKLTVGSVLLLLGGRALAGAGRTLVSDPARSLGAGFLVLCVLPVASTMALLTVIPFPLGLVGWALFAVLLYVAQLFAAQAAGDALLRRFRPDAWGSPILSLAVGLVPLVVLTSLPWFGPTAWLVATLFGAGALWLQLRTVAHA